MKTRNSVSWIEIEENHNFLFKQCEQKFKKPVYSAPQKKAPCWGPLIRRHFDGGTGKARWGGAAASRRRFTRRTTSRPMWPGGLGYLKSVRRAAMVVIVGGDWGPLSSVILDLLQWTPCGLYGTCVEEWQWWWWWLWQIGGWQSVTCSPSFQFASRPRDDAKEWGEGICCKSWKISKTPLVRFFVCCTTCEALRLEQIRNAFANQLIHQVRIK